MLKSFTPVIIMITAYLSKIENPSRCVSTYVTSVTRMRIFLSANLHFDFFCYYVIIRYDMI